MPLAIGSQSSLPGNVFSGIIVWCWGMAASVTPSLGAGCGGLAPAFGNKAEETDVIELSPGRKAQRTARWARTMTKWLITKSGKASVRWRFVEFGGLNGAESYGIVDIMAVRKNHRIPKPGLKRGDLLDIVLIQVKGGSAQRPSESDLDRLIVVAKQHRARAVVLVEWKKGQRLNLCELVGRRWVPRNPAYIFK